MLRAREIAALEVLHRVEGLVAARADLVDLDDSRMLELRARTHLTIESIDEVVRRHESLRTTIGRDGAEPVQIVGPAGHIELRVVDLTGERDPEAEARRRAEGGKV